MTAGGTIAAGQAVPCHVRDDCRADGGYCVLPAFKTITPVLNNLASPNGIALSKNGRTLWVTETFTRQLHRRALGAGDFAGRGVWIFKAKTFAKSWDGADQSQ